MSIQGRALVLLASLLALSSTGTSAQVIIDDGGAGGGYETSAAPAAPTGLVWDKHLSLCNVITIRWNATSNTTFYKVTRTDDGRVWDNIPVTGGQPGRLDDNQPPYNTGFHTYFVQAGNADGLSSSSNQVVGFYLHATAPVTVSASTTKATVVTIDWQQPPIEGSYAESYRIFRRETPGVEPHTEITGSPIPATNQLTMSFDYSEAIGGLHEYGVQATNSCTSGAIVWATGRTSAVVPFAVSGVFYREGAAHTGEAGIKFWWVTAAGGSPPYSYSWDAKACSGGVCGDWIPLIYTESGFHASLWPTEYELRCTVTDAGGLSQTVSMTRSGSSATSMSASDRSAAGWAGPEEFGDPTISVSAAPNRTLKVSFVVPTPRVLTLRLVDVAGRTVQNGPTHFAQRGHSTLAWSLAGSPAGMYWLTASDGDFRLSRRVWLTAGPN